MRIELDQIGRSSSPKTPDRRRAPHRLGRRLGQAALAFLAVASSHASAGAVLAARRLVAIPHRPFSGVHFQGSGRRGLVLRHAEFQGLGVKVARHGGPEFDPDIDDRTIGEDYKLTVRRFLRDHFPPWPTRRSFSPRSVSTPSRRTISFRSISSRAAGRDRCQPVQRAWLQVLMLDRPGTGRPGHERANGCAHRRVENSPRNALIAPVARRLSC